MFISNSVIMVAAVLTDLSGLLCLFFSRRCYAVLPFFWMMSRLAACSSQTDWLIKTWKRVRRISRAFRMVVSWVEMTDSTETSMRLNSSKQPHAPHWHRPEKIFPTAWQKKHIDRNHGSWRQADMDGDQSWTWIGSIHELHRIGLRRIWWDDCDPVFN